MFFKGNLAKNTITDGLVNPIDEWIIYETIEVEENKEQVVRLLKITKNALLSSLVLLQLKFSIKVSAAKLVMMNVTVCAIGHITRDCLESFGATVQVMPDTYTLTEVIDTLVEWKGRE